MSQSKNGNVSGRRASDRILHRMNKKPDYTERAGWIGFAIGVLVTSLVFVFILLPIAESDYANQQKEESSHGTPNTYSV